MKKNEIEKTEALEAVNGGAFNGITIGDISGELRPCGDPAGINREK